MCREEAKTAWSRADEMRDAGASRIACVVKEDIGTEVADFQAGFWPGEVYLDADLQFYKALGGGDIHRPCSLAAFLAIMLNPFSTSRVKKNVARSSAAGVAGNLTGEGLVTGGCYVLRPDGSAQYSYREEKLGDHAPIEEVIAAVRAAARNRSGE